MIVLATISYRTMNSRATYSKFRGAILLPLNSCRARRGMPALTKTPSTIVVFELLLGQQQRGHPESHHDVLPSLPDLGHLWSQSVEGVRMSHAVPA